eukprot:SAG25_NODE_559_length_6924_cov_15.045421_1_plen_83_part_10
MAKRPRQAEAEAAEAERKRRRKEAKKERQRLGQCDGCSDSDWPACYGSAPRQCSRCSLTAVGAVRARTGGGGGGGLAVSFGGG